MRRRRDQCLGTASQGKNGEVEWGSTSNAEQMIHPVSTMRPKQPAATDVWLEGMMPDTSDSEPAPVGALYHCYVIMGNASIWLQWGEAECILT
ncbi:unnamed protein product [Merluccius merluccius]